MGEASRFDPGEARVPTGQSGGGRFTAGGGGGAKKAPPHGAGHAKAPAAPAAHTKPGRKAELLAKAKADREEARQLEQQLAGLEHQQKAAQHTAAAGKAQGHAAKPGSASHSLTAAHHHQAAHHHHTKSLHERITSLRERIKGLREQAGKLEAEAKRTSPLSLREAVALTLASTVSRTTHTGTASTVHEPLGKPGGPGLFHHKGLQLPPYIQHVAHHLLAQGHDESTAIEMAVGIVRNWAAGHDGHGHHVHPDVQAAAAKNIAQWEADKARGATRRSAVEVAERAAAAPYGDVPYADPGYLDADGQQASKTGKPGVKRYPLSADKVQAAWSYINQEQNAGQYTPEQLSAIKGRIGSAMKKHGHEVSNDDGRAAQAFPELIRFHPYEDIHIVSRGEGDGSGRMVEAFAAVFDQPAEIRDFEGHYLETIERTAFNKRLADLQRSRGGFAAVKVLYNHGMTVHGTPSERFSMPVGTPVHIEATDRGLLTRTEYNRTPLAEEILELIRTGSITSQSFTGRIVRSEPQLARGRTHRAGPNGLPLVRRTELGLREYGTVLYPAYEGAEVFGVRMSVPGTFAAQEAGGTEDEALPPDAEAAAGEPLSRTDEHSARYHQHALYRLRSKELREQAGLVW